MADTETTKVIESLVDTLENGHKGFEDAAEKLEHDGRADLASEMRELSQQRGRMASELRDIVDSNGGSVGNGEGSVPGALHRSWMALRDALTGDDPYAVLAAAEEGEDHAVAEYRKAVSADLPESVRGTVERQAAEVKTGHDKVKALRDANA